MTNIRLLALALGAGVLAAVAQEPLLQNAPGRVTQTLNGEWRSIVDPYETGFYDYRYIPFDKNPNPGGNAFFTDQKPRDRSERIEYDFDQSPTLLVPRDWNSQDPKLFYYEGTVWYRRTFDFKKAAPDNRVFVHFGGANYQADVYLNGKKLGLHKGGFTPFNFEITSLLQPTNNSLVVKVDNKRKPEEVPTINTDWWNYGGLTRDVSLIETPPTFIRDFSLQLSKGSTETLSGYVQLDGPQAANTKVKVRIPDLDLEREVTPDANGRAALELSASSLRLWSPKEPFLYAVTFSAGADKVEDRIGFRTIETRGRDILLNGQFVFLRGICLHEENPLRGGRAFSREDSQLLLNWARELGCNFVRLAHYPHNEHMIRLADELGMLVWEENPVYWTIQWTNPATLATATAQLKEVIDRDKNRASVIIWSMANETPVGEARLAFLKSLAETARALDPTRLISAALEQHGKKGDEFTRTIDDPFAAFVDVVSFNEYIGWYDGLPDKCAKVKWEIPFDKPVIVSELGADALGGLHGDDRTRWSEEYQDWFYRENLEMIRQIPQLRGVTPWILADFRSPKRVLPRIQDGWNRKGLVAQSGQKKKAFFTLQKFYREMKERND